MTIQRIGSTEGLKDVFGAKVLPIISLVVVHNGIVSTCGITAEPTGDVKVQTKKVLASIDALLEKAGTDKSKLLTAQVWLADMQDFEEHNSVWNEWVDRQNLCGTRLRSNSPSTLSVCSALPVPRLRAFPIGRRQTFAAITATAPVNR
jgi:enamine deaminase RidA (YjgF/YER057c/UK114 family)